MALKLQSPDYHTAEVTLGADVTKGEFVTLGSGINGFYFVDAVTGEQATVVTNARKVTGPITGLTIAAGEPAYIITASGLLTNVSAGNVLVGYFSEAVANTDTEALIEFDGGLAFAKA